MNFAKSFGDTLSALQIDTKNTDIPKTTVEFVSNILGNLTKKQESPPDNHNKQQDNRSKEDKDSKELYNNPPNDIVQKSNKPGNTFLIFKLSGILSVIFAILNLDIIKQFILKFVSNTIFASLIIATIFLIISFCVIKYFIQN